MRKWYGWLFGGTAVILAGLLWIKGTMGTVAEVTLWEAQTQTVVDTVQCSGRLETAGSQEVYVDYLCVADKVLVKEGDTVERGDVLFTVDVTQTKQVLSTVAGISPTLVPDDTITQEVTAPVSGTLTSFTVSQGQEVSSQQACAVISSGETLQVAVAIAENQLRQVQVGQTVTVSGSAFAQDAYTGTVTSIASSARQAYVGTVNTTVVDAIITLDQADASLKPGLTAKTVIQVGQAEECLVVPYEYVLQDEAGEEYVYLFKQGTAVKQVIVTGREWSTGFAVQEGLSPGDRIVCQPERLAGDRVRVRVET